MTEDKFMLMQCLMGLSAELHPAEDYTVDHPPEGGYIGIHFMSVRYGFRVPPTRLVTDVYNYYRVVPGMLSPNSHRLLSCFQVLCQTFNVLATLDLFYQLFQFI